MKIKNEYDYLVHLVSCSINSISPQEKPKNISFEKVLECAVAHSVANLAYISLIKLKDLPDSDLLSKWKSYYYMAVQRDVFQLGVRDKIVNLFGENGIKSIELQGTAVKKFYPSSDMRVMSDVDIIIDKKDLELANELLLKNGFIFNKTVEAETSYKYNKIPIEIHTEFFSSDKYFDNGVPASEIINNPFSHVISCDDKTLSCKTDDTTFYLYNIMHMLKHYADMGVGIRRILDIYYLNKNFGEKIDKNVINDALVKCGLKEDFEDLEALSGMWFEFIEPKTDLTYLANEVYLAELHGTKDVVVYRRLNKINKKGSKFIKFRYLFSRLFMNKQRIYAAYPFCKKHHYPIVLCWFHRFFCICFSKKHRKNIKNELKAVDKNNLEKF